MRQQLFLGGLLLVLLLIGPRADAGGVTITPDVVYGHKYGMALTLDVFTPDEGANGAAVMFMVSGGWFSHWLPPEQLETMFRPLTLRGFTVFAVRHGSSPKFSIPEAVEDVRRSVRFVRYKADELGIDPERIGVFGSSAGGHLSLMLGTTADKGDPQASDPVLRQSSRVRAVVALVAPSDLTGMVWSAPGRLPAYEKFPALDLDVEKARDVSPLEHVTPDDAPTLLLVGDRDELVPMEHSERIYEALRQAKVETRLTVIEGAGHNLAGAHAVKTGQALVDWFEQQLAEAAQE